MAKIDSSDVGMVALVLIWGTAFVTLKEIGVQLGPFEIVWFRFLPFILGFGAWLVIRRREKLRALTGRDWLAYIGLGILAVPAYHLPVNLALDPTRPGALSPAMGAIIIASTPMFTAIWARVIVGAPLTAKMIPGYFLALGGVVLVVVSGGSEVLLGRQFFVILIAPLFWSLYSVLGKRFADRDGPRFYNALSMTLGALLLVPMGLKIGVAPLFELTTTNLLWVIYLGVFATAIGYTLWNNSVAKKGANHTSTFIYGIPIVATFAQIIILKQGIPFTFIVGASLVLVGVYAINRARVAAVASRLSSPKPQN